MQLYKSTVCEATVDTQTPSGVDFLIPLVDDLMPNCRRVQLLNMSGVQKLIAHIAYMRATF